MYIKNKVVKQLTVYKTTVILKVKAIIDGEETVERAIAHYTRRGTLEVLTYDEEIDRIGTVRHFITIQPTKVNVKRSGDITMNQQFQTNRITETLYHHPYGTFNMEVDTMKIEHQPLIEGETEGKVAIDYVTIIDQQTKQEHHLVLTYMEEK